MTPEELTGRARTHLVELTEPAIAMHRWVTTPFMNMRAAAALAGFDLKPVSGFRSFERQLTIWNAKFNGERVVHDARGLKLDVLRLTPAQRVRAILSWSALPGASRHHWGTDLDLIDARAVGADYRVELTTDEFSGSGPFFRVSAWLDANAARFGFFRPYRGIRSGVQAEPWHCSFAPVAETARRALTPAVLARSWHDAPMQGRDAVLEQLDELHSRYVAAIDWP